MTDQVKQKHQDEPDQEFGAYWTARKVPRRGMKHQYELGEEFDAGSFPAMRASSIRSSYSPSFFSALPIALDIRGARAQDDNFGRRERHALMGLLRRV